MTFINQCWEQATTTLASKLAASYLHVDVPSQRASIIEAGKTAALLPPRLRDAFALRYGKAEAADVRRFIRRARRNLSTLARSASPSGALSGGRTAACGKDTTGLRRTDVQPILDGSVRSRSVGVTVRG